MSDAELWRESPDAYTAVEAAVQERVAFMRRTYLHLAGAVIAFVLLEVLMFKSGIADKLFDVLRTNAYGWLLFLGGFMIAGVLANKFAHTDTSPGAQYAGLALLVIAEAIIFAPLLYVAVHYSSSDVLPSAAITTLLVFTGLTGAVFMTGKDFSFLRTGLMLAGTLALGLIVCAVIFGISLGIWFSLAMAALASAFVLYDTSNVLHHYRTNQHVAASLALFSSVALLFWYILRIFMALNRD